MNFNDKVRIENVAIISDWLETNFCLLIKSINDQKDNQNYEIENFAEDNHKLVMDIIKDFTNFEMLVNKLGINTEDIRSLLSK